MRRKSRKYKGRVEFSLVTALKGKGLYDLKRLDRTGVKVEIMKMTDKAVLRNVHLYFRRFIKQDECNNVNEFVID